MTDDDRAAVAKMIADAMAPRIVGPNGNAILPTPARTPFDWNGLWAQVGPQVLRIVNILITAAALYFGINASQNADKAASHAEAANASAGAGLEQAQKNGATLAATDKQVKRIVGAAVQE